MTLRLIAFSLILLLGFWALAQYRQPPPLAPLGEQDVILALGDSLTAGKGGQGVNYPDQLQRLIDRKVINAGINGETSAGAKKRLSDLLARHQPRLLIVCTGGNDFLQRLDSAKTEQNLADIIQTAHAAEVQVILVAVPYITWRPQQLSLYNSIAREHNLWVEDDILKTVLYDNRLKSDLIHPNAGGYQKMAAAIAALLKRAGAVT